jgi:hypothetical protein
MGRHVDRHLWNPEGSLTTRSAGVLDRETPRTRQARARGEGGKAANAVAGTGNSDELADAVSRWNSAQSSMKRAKGLMCCGLGHDCAHTADGSLMEGSIAERETKFLCMASTLRYEVGVLHVGRYALSILVSPHTQRLSAIFPLRTAFLINHLLIPRSCPPVYDDAMRPLPHPSYCCGTTCLAGSAIGTHGPSQ